MFGRSTTGFEKLVERATSHLHLEPDWESILQICDLIRSGEVRPRYALDNIKKRLYASNPHSSLYALQLLESCMKNCGAPFHQEVATKQFMEELRELINVTANEKVREKVLELLQCWALAFKNDPQYRAIQDAVNLMKLEGFKFPSVSKETEAMFTADLPPEWADGEVCHRCRVEFGMFQRQHHCRHCGQVFCGRCSSKVSTIPKFGIEREVRVCDDCYDKLKAAERGTHKKKSRSVDSSPQINTSVPQPKASAPQGKTEEELREEEELQLALALSQSEAESKAMEQKRRTNSASTVSAAPHTKPALKSTSSLPASVTSTNGAPEDPELSRYLNREYWEQRAATIDDVSSSTKPSAPHQSVQSVLKKDPTALTNHTSRVESVNHFKETGDDEFEDFTANLKSAIEIFVNRMHSNQARCRPIANDSAVQSLFLSITNMHSKLLQNTQQQEEARVYYESLQDKLGQVRDARAALDALREEHQDRLRREAEEQERERQKAMQEKLAIMRKKKQEYLEYQRELALQRMQEQERELRLRQEQRFWNPQVSAMGAHQPPPQPMYQVPGVGQMPYGMPPPNYDQQQATPGTTPPRPVTPTHPQPPIGSQTPPSHTPVQYPPSDPSASAMYAGQNYGQPYNMQTMANSLPNINSPAQHQPPTGIGHPGGQMGTSNPMSMSSPNISAMAAPAHEQPPTHQVQPPQQAIPQPPLPPPEPAEEAPLISFD